MLTRNLVRIENITLDAGTLEISFHKKFNEGDIELAMCLGFKILDRESLVVAEIRKTSKNALHHFMKRCFPYFSFHDSYQENRKILFSNIKAAYHYIEQRFDVKCKKTVRWDGELLKHQRESTMLSIMRTHNLLALDQGTGKSLCAITINEMMRTDENYKVLIVAPAACKWNWLEEHINWGFEFSDISIIDSANNHNGVLARIVIINYDLLDKYKDLLINLKFSHIILDEAHKIKNKGAARSKAVLYLKNALNPKFTFLSGTPVPNRVEDIWMYLVLSGHHLSQSEAAFKRTFFDVVKGKLVPKEIDFMYACLSNFMIRKTKDEVLSLPEKSYKRISIPFDTLKDEYEAAYEALENDLKARGKTVRIEDVYQRLNTITAKAKLKGVCEIMDSIVGERTSVLKKNVEYINGAVTSLDDYELAQGKIVLFCVNTEPLMILKQIYKDECLVINGAVSPRKRLEMINLFKSSRTINYLFCNTTAAGIGLNIVNKESEKDKVPICNVIQLNLPYTNAEIEQANDRVHRIGQYEKVTVWLPFLVDSIDEVIYKIVSDKYKQTSALVEGEEIQLQFKDVDDYLMEAFSCLLNKQQDGEMEG